MKHKHLPGIFAAVLALAVAVLGQDRAQAQPQAQAGAPKIAIKETEHSFGEVKKTANPSYTFVFKNEGKADLEIKRVAPT
jgi:hypothetical protein